MPYSNIAVIGELAPYGVFVYNWKEKEFEYLNEHFADLFRTDREELLEDASLVLPFILEEDNYYLRHCYQLLLDRKVLSDTEFRLDFNDGQIVHFSLDAYFLKDADETLIAGFLKDVTKSKEHENYIVNYGARKDTLLDMMTHNLAGPLNLSKNILNRLQNFTKEGPGREIGQHLKLIQDNTQECIDIVDDFLKEEHLESRGIYVKKTRFNVLDKIVVTIDKLIATNKNKKFSLVTNLENLNISTDSVKFFQIIHNLVSNAIKFTPDGGKIDILVEEKEKTFCVHVRDNGIGIPSHLHANLFDKRTSSSRQGLKKEMSTGLGLSIVKELVEVLDGHVSFTSAENRGSTFSVEFPKD